MMESTPKQCLQLGYTHAAKQVWASSNTVAATRAAALQLCAKVHWQHSSLRAL
jgi:hypothetical protein